MRDVPMPRRLAGAATERATTQPLRDDGEQTEKAQDQSDIATPHAGDAVASVR